MRRPAQILSTLVFLFFAAAVHAQQIIQTYAGGGPGAVQPYGLAADAAGNTYVGDYATHRVYKVTPSGQIIIVAGNGVQGYNGDNIPATSASLNYPPGVAVDSVGNVFIADYYNHRIRRVDASTGIITTVAGTGTAGFNGDNILAASANLYYPVSVAVDSAGNLYITDQYNQRIRFVNVSTGIISTVAGNGCYGYNGDNILATAACLYYPYDAKVDLGGNLYIADIYNQRVRRVMATGPSAGKIFTVAGNGYACNGLCGDGGAAINAGLYDPIGVEVDSAGNLYIADYYNQRVRVVNSAGTISTLAGTGTYCSSGSGACGDGGAANSAGLYYPVRVAAGGSGNLFIAEPWSSPGRLRQVSLSSGIISTRVGGHAGGNPGDGFLATSAGLYYPVRTKADSAGNLFIVEWYGHRVRRVDAATHIITTVAGGCAGYNGDNIAATSACLYYPFDVDVDNGGNLYIADEYNHRIRRVDSVTGNISTVAGNGIAGYNGDNIAATSANLAYPTGVTVDSSRNVFLVDANNNRVRRVDASTGMITTVAGGCYGYNGDNILATAACLNAPRGVALDSYRNVFIADFGGNRVRRVDASTGIITTVAGNGSYYYNGDNIPATSATLYGPHDVDVDSNGNLYIADLYNDRIRLVPGSGANAGKIFTVAGNGTFAFGGDGGSPTNASFYYPYGVSVDSVGNLYVADFYNQRVRIVRVDATPPVITETITGTLGNAGWYVSNVTVSWTVSEPDSTITAISGCGTSTVTTDTAGTTFTCTATSAGGTSSRSVTILRDTVPPVLALPANITVSATSTSGAVVTFTASANDALTGAQIPVCAPASGSLFPLGTTTVNCTVSDPAGNSSSGSFTVQVNAPVCDAPPSGLVSWWRAEANAIDIISGYNGTLQGGATFAPGKVGQAFNFDGVSGQVRVPNPPNLRMSAGLTIEAWIYPTGPGSSGPGGYGGILVNKEGEYEVARWNDGSIQWAIANTSPGWVWVNTGYYAAQGQWTHIVITYDGTAIRTYANGGLVHSYSGSGPIGDVSPGYDDVLIGGRGTSQFFQGKIDEVSIYNRALSASEISAIFNAAYIGKCVPPPTANAGPNQTVEATSATGASVTLDGSGSKDPDGDTLTYTWTGPFGTATGVGPSVTMPLGTNTVTLKVDDGHGDTATATVQITVRDTTPPSTSILTHPNSITNNTTASFSFTGNDLVTAAANLTFQCSLDNGAYAPCTSSQSYTVTGDGTHSFKVRATDAANNTDPSGASFTWTLDTTPPTITFAGQNPPPNSAGWNNTSVTLTWNCTDAVSGVVSPSVTQSLTTEGAAQSATATCTDNAGNSASNTQTGINIDKTAPTLTFAAATPVANANGWNNSNVSFGFTASDSLSGVASTSVPSPVVLSTEGSTVSGTVTVTDKAGNTATFTTPAVKIDKTPPTANAAASPGPSANGWNNTNVTVSFTGTDSLSGIDSCTAPITLSTEAANQSASGTCTDKAGNTSPAATASGINIDKTPPTASASASPGPNTNGWNNSNVVVSFTGTDSLSGIDFCTAPATLSTEGANQSASGTCTDKAGNVSAAAATTGINIDKTPPTLTFAAAAPAANANGWNNSNVSFAFTASDSLSGVASTSVPSPVVLSAEGAAVTGTVTVTDKAGNTATFTTPAVKIDKTPPTISATRTPAANANGWNNSSVNVSFACSDSLSGLAAGSPPAATTLSGEGANQSATGSCSDLAGNSASTTMSGINIDLTPPTITFASRTPANSNGWNNTSVTLTWNCADSLSGPVSPSVTQTLANEGAGQSSTGTCTDKAGNSASNTQTNVNIDETPPVLNGSVSPNPVVLNGTATASPGGTDSLSGIASQSCGALSTNSVGAKTVTCTATDKAGNTATQTVNYKVLYAAAGLMCAGDVGHTILQPINADGSSVWKLGSTVPGKFRLCDVNGVSIGTAGVITNFVLYQINAGTIAPVDETAVNSTNDLGWHFDSTGLQWIFNMSTKTAPQNVANQTYYYRVDLNDGTSIYFQFGLR